MRRKIDIGEAAKVAALCLPPVILSVIGLAAMGRKPRGSALAAGGKAAPAAAKPQPHRPA
ncbi:MAG: hypothetical protein MUD06_02920 [Rhodospirillales bacterium]|jgi:hypothetical protein|nr:hypothetical protein [Rhodospirillales bacterium]